MELVRYRPGEAIRWIQSGAEDIRKSAKRQSSSLVRREGERTIGKDIGQAAGALVALGRSAWADLKHNQAMASEYVLLDDSFEIVRPGNVRGVEYSEITGMRLNGDRLTVILERGSIAIKPHAYIVAGRIKVPIGWERNGLEVPYETMLDELAARCGVEIVRA